MGKENKKSKVIGVAFTRRGREKLALQNVIKETGADPERLDYEEHWRSKTARVTDSETGKTLGIFGW